MLPRLYIEGFSHCLKANIVIKRITDMKTAGTTGYPGTRNGRSISGLRHRRTYTAAIKSIAKTDNPTEAYLYRFWKSVTNRITIAHTLCAIIA